MGRRWTFDEGKLRAYVRMKERENWRRPRDRLPGGSVDRDSEIIRKFREQVKRRAAKRHQTEP
jgi:hypothetical protein